VKTTGLIVFTIFGFDGNFNRNILFILEIDPPLNMRLPFYIVIDCWNVTHTNADSSGVCFGIIAEYGVVFSTLTMFPTVPELMGE
jgi:hypothetical protein